VLPAKLACGSAVTATVCVPSEADSTQTRGVVALGKSGPKAPKLGVGTAGGGTGIELHSMRIRLMPIVELLTPQNQA